MNKRVLAILAIILAGVFGGLAPIFTKIAFKQMDPISIIFTRYFFAFLILFPITLIKRQFKIHKNDLLRIIISAVLFSTNVFFFVTGLQYTTSVPSQLLYLLTPAIVIMLSYLFFSQKITLNHIVSIFIGGLGGLILIVRSSNNQLINSLGTLHGNSIIVLSVCAWSLYIVVSKKLSSKYSPIMLVTINALIATLIALMITLFQKTNLFHIYSSLTTSSLLSLAGLVVFNSIGFFLLFQWAAKHISPFATSYTTYFSPFSAAVFGIFLLGESLSFTIILSGILIFISSYITMKRKKV